MTLDDHDELQEQRFYGVPYIDRFIVKAATMGIDTRHLMRTREALVNLMVQAERQCLEAVPPPGAVQPRERVISVPYLRVVDAEAT
jgi:hypothetical protein